MCWYHAILALNNACAILVHRSGPEGERISNVNRNRSSLLFALKKASSKSNKMISSLGNFMHILIFRKMQQFISYSFRLLVYYFSKKLIPKTKYIHGYDFIIAICTEFRIRGICKLKRIITFRPHVSTKLKQIRTACSKYTTHIRSPECGGNVINHIPSITVKQKQ